jgi:hypothetical protein
MRPVRNSVRDGQQMGVLTKAFVSSAPSSTRSFWVWGMISRLPIEV